MFQSESIVKELLDISLSLSESTRPQDSTTAAYLLSVLTHQSNMHIVLTQHIQTCQYGTIDLETDCSGQGSVDGTNLTESGAVVPRQRTDVEKLLTNVRGGESELVRRYILLEILTKNLESQTVMAKSSLIVAAANKPLYPTIQCMRYCFAEVQYRYCF